MMSFRDKAVRRLGLACVLGLLSLLAMLASKSAPAAEAPDKNLAPMVPHRTFSKDCSLCHVPKRWDIMRSDFRFDHFKETKYALNGMHATVSCLRCHNDRGSTAGVAARGCVACHVDLHKGAMGLSCTKCHNETSWKTQGRQGERMAEHSRTGFPLTGMHATLQCAGCHKGASVGDFRGLSRDCLSCHRTEFNGAKPTPSANHETNGFPQTCQSCHGTSAWGPGTEMKHSVVGGVACYNCHSGDFQRGPNHVAQNFARSCQTCHVTTGWRAGGGGTFDHNSLGANPNCFSCHSDKFASAKATPSSNHASNGFPQSCQDCHKSFAAWGPGTPMPHSFVGSIPCYNCHTDDFKAAPNHLAQNFSHTCQSCHSGTATWLSAGFDHRTLGANPNCYSCHQAAYIGARPTPAAVHSPNFPQTCQNCHTTALWGPGTAMKHNFVSSVPCYTCHQADFAGGPNHVAMNFSHTCQSCHVGTASWMGAAFDHNTLGANPNCYACHTAAFATAKATPASNHTTNAFPQTCQNCHNTTVWGPGTQMKHNFVSSTPCYTCHTAEFNGAKITPASNHTANAFPTTSPACQTCHTAAAAGFAVWSGVNMAGSSALHNVVGGVSCYNCHKAEYNAANATPSSKHAANSFPQACQNCHTGFSAWGPGTAMKHNFVTSIPCYTCHAQAFTAANATPASKHVANAFPTACQNCHVGTTVWGPGTTMQHAFVGGTGAQCQTCHMAEFNAAVSPVNHSGFVASSCRQCHTSFVSWTSFIHNPSSCYNSSTNRSHKNATCAQCHPGGNYLTASCTACHRNRSNCDD
jgi:hypothetical protein